MRCQVIPANFVVFFCNRSNFENHSGSYATEGKKIIIKTTDARRQTSSVDE